MPRTIDDYINAARAHARLSSDTKLASELGLKSPSVSNWRTKKTWPNDETMVRLAELSGIAPREALLDLAQWRAKGASRHVWHGIAKDLGVASVAAFMAIGSAFPSPPQAFDVNAHKSATAIVCIMENRMVCIIMTLALLALMAS